MLLNRRAFLATAAAPLTAGRSSVEIGVQSFSFKRLPFDEMLDACERCGVRSVEVWSGHVEAPWVRRGEPGGRERMRDWRIRGGAEACARAREAISRRGMRLNSFNLSIRNEFSDEELDAAFRMTHAFGTDILTTSSNVSTAARIDPFAQRHEVYVGFHNHTRIREDEFATPDDFRRATEGFSTWLGVNLDVGHYHAAGFDCLEFPRERGDRTWVLHMKDRRSNDGEKTAFGAGDTPLREILWLLADQGLSIPANVEMAYPTGDPVREVAESVAYMRRALARRPDRSS